MFLRKWKDHLMLRKDIFWEISIHWNFLRLYKIVVFLMALSVYSNYSSLWLPTAWERKNCWSTVKIAKSFEIGIPTTFEIKRKICVISSFSKIQNGFLGTEAPWSQACPLIRGYIMARLISFPVSSPETNILPRPRGYWSRVKIQGRISI